jgi:hypothetical protein
VYLPCASLSQQSSTAAASPWTAAVQAHRLFESQHASHMSCYVSHLTAGRYTNCMTMLAASSGLCWCCAANYGSPGTQSVCQAGARFFCLRGALGLRPCAADHCWAQNTHVSYTFETVWHAVPCRPLCAIAAALCRRRASVALALHLIPVSKASPCLQQVLLHCIIGSVACCIIPLPHMHHSHLFSHAPLPPSVEACCCAPASSRHPAAARPACCWAPTR